MPAEPSSPSLSSRARPRSPAPPTPAAAAPHHPAQIHAHGGLRRRALSILAQRRLLGRRVGAGIDAAVLACRRRTRNYEPYAFVVAVAASALELSKNEVDLARLLPLSIDDLDDGGDSGFGKWSTSFWFSKVYSGGLRQRAGRKLSLHSPMLLLSSWTGLTHDPAPHASKPSPPSPPGKPHNAGDRTAPPQVLSAGAPQLFDKMPKEQAMVSYGRKAGLEAPVGDGIDALPDEVLQHVFSIKPTMEAVQTRILARCWRGIWKSMPVLRITSKGRTMNRRGVRRLNSWMLTKLWVPNLTMKYSSKAQSTKPVLPGNTRYPEVPVNVSFGRYLLLPFE